jgi:hypothetical protein
MPIVLSDIRTAVQTYLNTNVTTTISAVVPAVPGTLNPGEEGTFNVTITNAVVGGIRLTNVVYHLTTSNSSVLNLKVPAAATAVARSGVSSASPVLAPNAFVTEMFLFPVDNSLDVGDSDSLNGLKVKAIGLGNADITCHVHADPDENYLFVKGENSTTTNRAVSVV